jgi:YHS domain-containing protein
MGYQNGSRDSFGQTTDRHSMRPATGPLAANPDEIPGQPSDVMASRAGGNPPWGLEGYCPVALLEHSKWVKGDSRWGVVHRGHTYLFSSVDAKQRFWANPDRYTPALSGIDPVIFADSGQRVEGSRSKGVVYLDQVYLFANEQSLQRFWRSPKGYAEQVRQATIIADRQDRWR